MIHFHENKFSAKGLEGELTSGAFLSGIHEAIGVTQRTGREAGYRVRLYKGVFVYPEDICLGDENRVWVSGNEYSKETKKRYEQETKGISPGSPRYYQLSYGVAREQLRRYMKWIEEKNGDEKTAFSIPFPITRDWNARIEVIDAFDRYKLDRLKIRENEYAHGITVHTHPPKLNLIYPSPRDLESLHSVRKVNTLRSTPFNPLSVIIGTFDRGKEGLEPYYPVLVIQEKENVPYGDITWREMSDGFLIQTIHSLLPVVDATTLTPPIQVGDFYNTVRFRYLPHERTLEPYFGSYEGFVREETPKKLGSDTPEKRTQVMKMMEREFGVKNRE